MKRRKKIQGDQLAIDELLPDALTSASYWEYEEQRNRNSR